MSSCLVFSIALTPESWSKRMAGSGAADTISTIFYYLVGHRLFVFALNLVVGSFFLIFIHSVPWLKRRGIYFAWFRLFVKEPSSIRASSHPADLNTEHTSSSKWLPLRRFTFSARPPITSADIMLQSLESGFVQPARELNRTHVTPFTDTETPSSLSRSGSEASKRSSTTTMTAISRRQRLEPLRRPFMSSNRDVPDIMNEASGSAGGAIGSTVSLNHTEISLLTSPPPTPSITDPDPLDVDLSDMRLPETPTATSITDEDPPETSGRHRPPTYGTTFSQYSFATLPVYRENEDDRMSVASRAPTYRSVVAPRSPHRSARPPLPVPPSSYAPRVDLASF